MQNPRNTALYLRISDDKSGDALGVQRQREDCLAVAQARGWHVATEHVDNDISAKGNVRRPGFEALLEQIDRGEVDVVLAWNLDRLTRNRRDTVRLIDAGQAHQLTVALVRGSDMDMSTSSGRMVAGILSEVAQAEIATKSERQIRAYRQQAEAGKPHFVARPYGYTRQGELIEAEAAVLHEFAQKYLNGWGLAEIRKWANNSGLPAATGGTWSNRVIRDHLLCKRNVGIRVYKGEEFPGAWTPVFDQDTHERLIAENKRRADFINTGPHSNRRRYLLTGLLICGKCGQRMTGHRRSDRAGLPKRDKYNCVGMESGIGCKGQVRVAETLEHFIREAVIFRLDSPQMAQMLARKEKHSERIDPLRGRQEALKVRIESLLDDYTDGTLTKPEYQRAKGRLQSDLESVDRELTGLYSSQQAAAILDAGTTVREAWERESMGWRRKLIGLVIERIVVKPSTKRTAYVIDGKMFKFDPSDIEIEWLA